MHAIIIVGKCSSSKLPSNLIPRIDYNISYFLLWFEYSSYLLSCQKRLFLAIMLRNQEIQPTYSAS
jgi:hypothetical protein